MLQPIERNGTNLLHLINQILDLAKLESKSIELEMRRGDIISYLKYVMESFQSIANVHNQVLRFQSTHTEFEMDFDPQRMAQIVNNLLSNALKHTPPGGSIFLKVEILSDQQFMLSVKDTGSGIDAADLPHIFERYYQGKFKNNQTDTSKINPGTSTGIGLAVIKELIELLGGKIHVESSTHAEAHGTEFRITLPVTREAPLLSDEWKENHPQSRVNIHENISDGEVLHPSEHEIILLVEDNADVTEFVKLILGSRFKIINAYNGRAGLDLAVEAIPDIIISDLMMPEMDGLELCKAVKTNPLTDHIPFILLTARANVEDRISGINVGADAYLVKLFHPDELSAILQNLIQQRKKLREKFQTAHPVNVEESESVEDRFIRQLKNIILENLEDPQFSVEVLCKELAMSQPQLHRKLNSITGKNASGIIREIKMEKALELLKTGQYRVSDIAYQVGFDNPKYFSKVFKETYGKLPSQWGM